MGPPGGGARFSYRGHDIERVHIHPFIYPPGFGYRRWEVGAALPPLFFNTTPATRAELPDPPFLTDADRTAADREIAALRSEEAHV